MGKEVLAGDHSNDTHVSLSLLRLCHRAVLPRVRQGLRTGPALRLRGVVRPARGPLRLPGRDPVRHRGRPAEHVALAAATEMGFKVLACPSTGNLANAVAAAAARAGVRSVVMVPADLELQKIITTSVYGGTFVTVDGTYDDVNRLASELAGEHP